MSTDEVSGPVAVAKLIELGWLIPVQVFGTDECCVPAHRDTACPSKGHGLCDRFSTHTPAGSDCNRADFYLLRPSDAATYDPHVRAALNAVLDEFP